MYLAYSLPVSTIREHVKESEPIFTAEGTYPHVLSGGLSTQLDNYTNAFFMRMAIYEQEGVSDFESSLQTSYYSYRNKTEIESLFEAVSGSEENRYLSDYSYHWNGQMIWVKSMLYLFNFAQFREVNLYILMALTLLVAALMGRRRMLRYSIPFAASMFVINPFIVANCMILSCTLYGILISMAVVLAFHEWFSQKGFYPFLFMVFGAATVYMFGGYYAIAMLGFPLTLYFVLNARDNARINLGRLIALCLCWGGGYMVMWLGKIVLAGLFTNMNTFGYFLEKVAERTSHTTTFAIFTALDVIRNNWTVYFGDVQYIAQAMMLVIALVTMVIGRVSNRGRFDLTRDISDINVFISLSIIPVVWHIILQNMNYIHFWATYRVWSVTPFALGCLLMRLGEPLDIRFPLRQNNKGEKMSSANRAIS